MPRAIWKGTIRFEDVAIPVKLYSAVEDKSVHFRLLHEPDHTPISEGMVNPTTGEVVDYEEIRRGYQLEDGTVVALEPKELKKIEPEATRDIEITRFVDPALLGQQFYNRPYFLTPDEGDGANYSALARALEAEGVEGIAHWTMRKKLYSGALRSEGDHLLLITLRHAEEVVSLGRIPRAAEDREISAAEIKLARQLISTLESDFDPTQYQDDHRERVMELIEAKASGKVIPLKRAPRKKAAPKSLVDALRASVGGTGRKNVG